MLSRRSTLFMMRISRARSFSSQLSFLSLRGVLMKKGGTCCVESFVLQPNEKEFSLVSTAVELGLASLATYNFQFLKQFSIAWVVLVCLTFLRTVNSSLTLTILFVFLSWFVVLLLAKMSSLFSLINTHTHTHTLIHRRGRSVFFVLCFVVLCVLFF